MKLNRPTGAGPVQPPAATHDPAPGASLPGATRDSMPPMSYQPVTLQSRFVAYRLLWVIGLVVFALDQLTKYWVVARIPFNRLHAHGGDFDIEVIRGFFYIIHVGNTGAAWSMFSNRSILLAVLAAATLVAIYFWRHHLGLRARMAQVCFGLLCGGILGNLVDRIVHKHVIDFIDLHFTRDYIYPTFNVADSGICVGVILYIWISLRDGKRT
ncbi:MAG TPA: signal peptidase II [Opitutaceae bacterium]|nr:signal peptidase II [Opitutaceae bacterium]